MRLLSIESWLNIHFITFGASALLLTGCPDPEAEYNAFNTRKDPFVVVIEGGEEAGAEAGSEAGAEAGAEAGVQGGAGGSEGNVPMIQSGQFLLGLAPNLNPDKPMGFITQVNIEINEDRTGGRLISMQLDPRVCEESDPTRPSAGDGINYQPEEAPVINSRGEFTADFGEQEVPATANCISGSFINAVIKLKGTVISEDAICGTVSGNLILPFEHNLLGSTFAAVRFEGDSIENVTVPRSCMDVMGSEGDEGGAEGGAEAGAQAGVEGGAEAGAEGGAPEGGTGS